MSNRGGYTIEDQFATHFLTFTTVGWVDLFTRKACREILLASFRYCIRQKGLSINAYVIMSNHVHMIASAGEASGGLSSIIRDMKRHTSKSLINWVLQRERENRKDWIESVFRLYARQNRNNSLFQVWQHNSMPKVCLHPRFTMQKIDYIHQNPVVANIVDRAEDYLYSSARNYACRDDFLMEVDVIDFGVGEGYIMT